MSLRGQSPKQSIISEIASQKPLAMTIHQKRKTNSCFTSSIWLLQLLGGRNFITMNEIDESKNKPTPKREYPPLYEKVIPIAVGVILFAIAILLLIILCVVGGLLPGAG
jgi:hypothetical protein